MAESETGLLVSKKKEEIEAARGVQETLTAAPGTLKRFLLGQNWHVKIPAEHKVRKGKAEETGAGNFSVEDPTNKMPVCQVLKVELDRHGRCCLAILHNSINDTTRQPHECVVPVVQTKDTSFGLSGEASFFVNIFLIILITFLPEPPQVV